MQITDNAQPILSQAENVSVCVVFSKIKHLVSNFELKHDILYWLSLGFRSDFFL